MDIKQQINQTKHSIVFISSKLGYFTTVALISNKEILSLSSDCKSCCRMDYSSNVMGFRCLSSVDDFFVTFDLDWDWNLLKQLNTCTFLAWIRKVE